MVPGHLTEGELWAREQLGLLLGARFSPVAVARFLAASQRRASAERGARPATARRMRSWIGAGMLAWALPAAAGVEPFRRRARSFALWWALTAIMLDWHIGMVETEDGRPRNLGPADACTLARVWLVPLAADTPAPWVCAAAFATDGLDGRLARWAESSRIGRDLEGLADAAFAAAALRGALRRGWIGRPVAAGELVRVGLGFCYALVVWFGRADAPDPRVLHAARVTTPVRVAGLLAAGSGRRRLADLLVGGGAAWSAATVLIALSAEDRGQPPAPASSASAS